ncbi:hypothetical protein ACFX2B_037729 [Malus domestica]
MGMVLLNNIDKSTEKCITNDLFYQNNVRFCRVEIREYYPLFLKYLGARDHVLGMIPPLSRLDSTICCKNKLEIRLYERQTDPDLGSVGSSRNWMGLFGRPLLKQSITIQCTTAKAEHAIWCIPAEVRHHHSVDSSRNWVYTIW